MNQMDEEKYLKTFKKDELIKRVIKLEEELAKCKSELDEDKTEAKKIQSKLSELEEYKKETESWTFGLVKTLLENEDNRNLFASQLAENIKLIVDERVCEKLVLDKNYSNQMEYVSILYDGHEIEEKKHDNYMW